MRLKNEAHRTGRESVPLVEVAEIGMVDGSDGGAKVSRLKRRRSRSGRGVRRQTRMGGHALDKGWSGSGGGQANVMLRLEMASTAILLLLQQISRPGRGDGRLLMEWKEVLEWKKVQGPLFFRCLPLPRSLTRKKCFFPSLCCPSASWQAGKKCCLQAPDRL